MPTESELDRHRPRAHTMEKLLARLDESHGTDGRGGSAGWLLANGLTENELSALRKRFVEEG